MQLFRRFVHVCQKFRSMIPRTRPLELEWCQCQCPWVTRDLDFKRRAGLSATAGLSCLRTVLGLLLSWLALRRARFRQKLVQSSHFSFFPASRELSHKYAEFIAFSRSCTDSSRRMYVQRSRPTLFKTVLKTFLFRLSADWSPDTRAHVMTLSCYGAFLNARLLLQILNK